MVDLVDGGDAVRTAIFDREIFGGFPQRLPLGKAPVPDEPHRSGSLTEQRLLWLRGVEAVAISLEHPNDDIACVPTGYAMDRWHRTMVILRSNRESKPRLSRT